jgi:hypothetical protein
MRFVMSDALAGKPAQNFWYVQNIHNDKVGFYFLTHALGHPYIKCCTVFSEGTR